MEKQLEEALTNIPAEFLTCVAFLGFRPPEEEPKVRGTAFFLSHRVTTDVNIPYLVTAKHNVDRVAKVSSLVSIRVNVRGHGAQWFETKVSNWVDHPTDSSVDAMVLPIEWNTDWDHGYFPIEMRVHAHNPSEAVAIGDELFFPGLFSPHYGEDRNIPIVRIGNIAAMPSEKVAVRFDGGTIKKIDAYLAEVRSMGGLSGSPVFAYMIGHRFGAFRLSSVTPFRLLGLIRGHFDAEAVVPDTALAESEERPQRINMGIATVVPAQKILEVIENPRNQEYERNVIELGLIAKTVT